MGGDFWKFSFFLFVLTFLGCSSIEGTRNKSYTFRQFKSYSSIGKIAILPIEESSQYPLLPEMIESDFISASKVAKRQFRLIPSSEFSHMLHEENKLDTFNDWYSEYQSTKYIDKDRILSFIKNIDADFLISIRKLNIDREKVRAVDTGYQGWVSAPRCFKWVA